MDDGLMRCYKTDGAGTKAGAGTLGLVVVVPPVTDGGGEGITAGGGAPDEHVRKSGNPQANQTIKNSTTNIKPPMMNHNLRFWHINLNFIFWALLRN